VGSTAKIFGLANQYREALAVSAQDKKTKTDHSAGHFLREKILDPFIGDLTGVGRYAIIAPPELLQFPLTAMPEQAEGLRWLADIRQVTGSPTIATLQRKLRDVDADTYKLDYLAFGADTPPPQENELTDFEAPDELKICGRYFRSGFDEVLVGKAATVETWKAKAENARYIHIADIGPAMNGGFQLADGPLSLDEVRNTRLHAELVVITGRTTTEQQLRRARAFMDAGARWVIVSGWFVPDRTRVKYLSNIFDSMNQERPPVRAMSEGRNALFRDALMGIDLDDPSLWGGLTLFGKP
jgi:CHAT domain-containing protein